jgi:hypothetical protein
MKADLIPNGGPTNSPRPHFKKQAPITIRLVAMNAAGERQTRDFVIRTDAIVKLQSLFRSQDRSCLRVS